MFSSSPSSIIQQNLQSVRLWILVFLMLSGSFLSASFLYAARFSVFNNAPWGTPEELLITEINLIKESLRDEDLTGLEREKAENGILLREYLLKRYGKGPFGDYRLDRDNLYQFLFLYDEVLNHPGALFFLFLLFSLMLKGTDREIRSREELASFFGDQLKASVFFSLFFLWIDLAFAWMWTALVKSHPLFKLSASVPVVKGGEIREIPVWVSVLLHEAEGWIRLLVLFAAGMLARSVSRRKIVRFPVALLLLVIILYPYRMDSLSGGFWTEYDTRVNDALFPGMGFLMHLGLWLVCAGGAWLLARILRMLPERREPIASLERDHSRQPAVGVADEPAGAGLSFVCVVHIVCVFCSSASVFFC